MRVAAGGGASGSWRMCGGVGEREEMRSWCVAACVGAWVWLRVVPVLCACVVCVEERRKKIKEKKYFYTLKKIQNKLSLALVVSHGMPTISLTIYISGAPAWCATAILSLGAPR